MLIPHGRHRNRRILDDQIRTIWAPVLLRHVYGFSLILNICLQRTAVKTDFISHFVQLSQLVPSSTPNSFSHAHHKEGPDLNTYFSFEQLEGPDVPFPYQIHSRNL